MTRGGKTTGLARYSTNLVGEKEKENRVRERQKKKEKKEVGMQHVGWFLARKVCQPERRPRAEYVHVAVAREELRCVVSSSL